MDHCVLEREFLDHCTQVEDDAIVFRWSIHFCCTLWFKVTDVILVWLWKLVVAAVVVAVVVEVAAVVAVAVVVVIVIVKVVVGGGGVAVAVVVVVPVVVVVVVVVVAILMVVEVVHLIYWDQTSNVQFLVNLSQIASTSIRGKFEFMHIVCSWASIWWKQLMTTHYCSITFIKTLTAVDPCLQKKDHPRIYTTVNQSLLTSASYTNFRIQTTAVLTMVLISLGLY